MLFLIVILPESPRWLAAHGKEDESLSVLRRLNRHKMSDDEILLIHAQIMTTVEYEASIGAGKWKDLLKNDEIQSQRRFLIACSVQAFQQLGGINVSKSRAGGLPKCILMTSGTNILLEYNILSKSRLRHKSIRPDEWFSQHLVFRRNSNALYQKLITCRFFVASFIPCKILRPFNRTLLLIDLRVSHR